MTGQHEELADAAWARTEAFMSRVFADTAGFSVTILAHLGDRLGLFTDLATGGPATSEQLAERTGIKARYAREWLNGMACAGYLDYTASERMFALPPERIPVLATEGGPCFIGGMHQMLVGLTGPLSLLATAFREGGGVPPSAFADGVWDGMERFSSNWSQQLFVQACLPAMPDIQDKLEQGARVVEVGCGRGGALIRLAEAFPASTFTGYDLFSPAVERARSSAHAAGVSARVTFECGDAADGLPAGQDVVLAFDVVHEATAPGRLLTAVHDSLGPNGMFACLEMTCSEKLEDNLGPRGAFLYGMSLLHCMTTSLASGGEGLGALGLPEVTLRKLCTDAGFGELRRVMQTPFVSLYEVAR